jgi:hypothetical protein
MSKDYGIEYWGKLEERELLFLIEILEEKVKSTPICGGGKLLRKLKENFYGAESYEEATLKNKFVESITIQH